MSKKQEKDWNKLASTAKDWNKLASTEKDWNKLASTEKKSEITRFYSDKSG